MSDHQVKSYADGDGKARASIYSHQSFWIAHWTQTSFNPAPETRTSEIMNDNLGTSFKNMIYERLGSQPLPMVKNDLENLCHVQTFGTQINKFERTTSDFYPLPNHAERVKPHMFFGESSFTISRPSQKPSKIIQEEINVLSSVEATKEHLSDTNLTAMRREHCNYSYRSSFLVPEKKKETHFEKYFAQCLRPNKRSVSPFDDQSPLFAGEKYEMLKNCHGTGLFQSHGSLEMNKSGYYSLKGGPYSVLDVEAGSTSTHLHGRSPYFGNAKGGVKIQLLSSSTDNEEKRNPEKVCGDESSTETDTMDMDAFKEKKGVDYSSWNKDITAYTTRHPETASSSSPNKVEAKQSTRELPDMNIQVSTDNSAMINLEPNTSRTESLDMELLQHHQHPDHNNSIEFHDCRWVKRLRLNGSDSFGNGTKSSPLVQSYSPARQKVNKIFGNIEKGKMGISNNEESKNLKSRDIGLSDNWIQRWRQKPITSTVKKQEAVVVCDPQCSKLRAMEDLQKKQFPSIAAMALMGKAVNGFQPCEFRKKGSFVVWNT